MFAGLRQHNPFYILEKGENMSLKKGQVLGISNLMPKYSHTAPHLGPTSTVDVTVKVGEETVDFKQLPSNSSIANFGLGNIVVSDNSEDMMLEIESMFKVSKDVMESVPYHTMVMEKCEEYLQMLNPKIAKEKEQESKINALEDKIGNIETTLTDMKEMWSTFLQTPKTE